MKSSGQDRGQQAEARFAGKRIVVTGVREGWEHVVRSLLAEGACVATCARTPESLKDLPVQVLARMRSDRALRRPALSQEPHTRGRPPRHGSEFLFSQPDTWGTPDTETLTTTCLHGTATARSWDRLHPKLTHRSSWAAADGTLPIVEGTVIRLDIEHLPSGATPKPVWLWWSGTDATEMDTDRLWQAYLRRFDIEHTFRLFKHTLGWT